MKTRRLMKFIPLFIFVCYCSLPVHAQTNPVVDEYLKAAGGYAAIYNGEIELNYSPNIYENFPYLDQEEFTVGEVLFKDNRYPDIMIRLDLYKDQLITLAPENHLCMIINPDRIGWVKLHGKKFVYLQKMKDTNTPEKGYYQLLHEGSRLALLARVTFANKKVTGEMLLQDSKRLSEFFVSRTRYYLKTDGQYRSINNPKLFAKIFPEHRKSIKQFLKKEKQQTQENEKLLIALTRYCEQFTN